MQQEILDLAGKAMKIVVDTMVDNHGKGNVWLKVSMAFHLKHAREHIDLFMSGNEDEDHLAHAVTRIMMARHLSGK